ncbi:hypothetical protein XENTR_v10017691 [Xenopus tropicalis]|nr:hypothetical protein XENTR_v10017691 [Xenopus tropicalis]
MTATGDSVLYLVAEEPALRLILAIFLDTRTESRCWEGSTSECAESSLTVTIYAKGKKTGFVRRFPNV